MDRQRSTAPHRRLAALTIDIRSVLGFYAEAGPPPPKPLLNVAGNDGILELPISMVRLISEPTGIWEAGQGAAEIVAATPHALRLHKTARLLADQQPLRVGMYFLCGPLTVGATTQRVCLPLLSRPVDMRRSISNLGQFSVSKQGHLELTTLVGDLSRRNELLQSVEYGGGGLTMGALVPDKLVARLPKLNSWLREVCAQADIQPRHIVGNHTSLKRLSEGTELVVATAIGLFLNREPFQPNVSSALMALSSTQGVDRTALDSLINPVASGGPNRSFLHDRPDDAVQSALRITTRQRAIIHSARRNPTTVVMGAPGTGKSHAVVAATLDLIGRGSSVLIATLSDEAAEVLARSYALTKGPPAVNFGSADDRRSLPNQLVEHTAAPARRSDAIGLRSAGSNADAHVAQTALQIARDDHRAAVLACAMSLANRSGTSIELDPVYQQLGLRLDHRNAWQSVLGLLRRRRNTATIKELSAHARQLVADTASSSATDDETDQLIGRALEYERTVRDALGRAEHEAWEQRVDASGRKAINELAAALRQGRAGRRRALATVDIGELTKALPVWIGTIRDIDDILPSRPAMFDVVILDEASQIDQPTAALALARARRSVVVGDPRQLRHVSFVPDERQLEAARSNGLLGTGELPAQLDIRRNSVLDLAAAHGHIELDEHFRSAPHLISFPIREFYGTQIHIATRHPSNEVSDRIEVVYVDGTKSNNRNEVEVRAVLDLIRSFLDADESSVGIVTPFSNQAKAIETAILDTLTAEEIDKLRLRVGTAHSFQGAERDVMIVSTVVGPDESQRFLNDPNLFNVMVTRARNRQWIVTSVRRPDGSARSTTDLLGRYLNQADTPPFPALSADPTDPWTKELSAFLAVSAIPVRVDYEVGRWVIDMVVGSGEASLALELRVHPNGLVDHLERRSELCSVGWQVMSAFSWDWQHRPVELATAITDRLDAMARNQVVGARERAAAAISDLWRHNP